MSSRRTEWLRSIAAAPTSPSAYALLLSLLATVAAKTYAAWSLSHGHGYILEALGACAADLAIYPALALLVSAGERTRRWVAILTYPMSIFAVVVALINAAYVAIANDQIDARILSVGMNRFDEVADIALMEATARAGRVGVYVVAGALLGYFGIRVLWRRAKLSHEALAQLRLRGLLGLSVLGCAFLALTRVVGLPRTLAADLIADNALLHTYVTWLDGTLAADEKYEGALEQHFAAPMVPPQAAQQIAKAQTPNVLVLLLESTRFDHVELPLPGHVSHARTPALRALAQRGTFFTHAYAAMPHTSKSLVSILCGRLPAMENPVAEVADDVLPECLPRLFHAAGYATSFLQSAIGSFEYRPRLTVQLGYDDFQAFETIHTRPLGYLAGDDRVLPHVFGDWLSRLPAEQRFFATILTSGTHHPYQLPKGVRAADVRSGRSRYAALVETEDHVLSDLLEVLRKSGRLDNTLIVALADHGEGLPGDAVRQHDNNFFDEGLHVPVIIAGPGVAARQYDEVTSLLDIAPSLLGIIGVNHTLPSEELRFGADVLHASRPRSYAPFACWNDETCEGYISRDVKVVRMPADHRELAFELHGKLQEPSFRRPTSAELQVLERVHEVNASTHLSKAPLQAAPIRLASGFACGPGLAECAHPSRPEGGFHAIDPRMLQR